MHIISNILIIASSEPDPNALLSGNHDISLTSASASCPVNSPTHFDNLISHNFIVASTEPLKNILFCFLFIAKHVTSPE